MKKKVSSSLNTWFKIHFIVDFILAALLIFFPQYVFDFFGVTATPALARLIGAALIAIGGVSFLCKTKQQFDILLQLKLIWSSIAIVVLIPSAFAGITRLWIVIGIFFLFFLVWIYYKCLE